MTNIYTQTENNVKAFVNDMLDDAKKCPDTVQNCQAIAFGALMFAVNYCFPSYNNNLDDWWEDEAYPKFREIAMNKG